MHPGTRIRATRITEPRLVLANAVSAWFVPAVIAIVMAAFIALMIWGPPPARVSGIGATSRFAVRLSQYSPSIFLALLWVE